MLSKDQARALLAARLGEDVVILDERTIEKDWGWVFFYQSRRFVETGNPHYRLLGNAPRIVNRLDGSIHYTDTKYPLERYIQRYERQLTGAAPEFGENPRAWLDYVTFDTAHYVCERDPPGGPDDFERNWHMTDGTVHVTLRLTILPPILPASAESIAQIEHFCRSRTRVFRIMEVQLATLDGIDCIWTLLTTPSGARTSCYFGEITIPFAAFTFQLLISTLEADGPAALLGIRREFAWISSSLRVDKFVKDQKRFELPHDPG